MPSGSSLGKRSSPLTISIRASSTASNSRRTKYWWRLACLPGGITTWWISAIARHSRRAPAWVTEILRTIYQENLTVQRMCEIKFQELHKKGKTFFFYQPIPNLIQLSLQSLWKKIWRSKRKRLLQRSSSRKKRRWFEKVWKQSCVRWMQFKQKKCSLWQWAWILKRKSREGLNRQKEDNCRLRAVEISRRALDLKVKA